MRREREVRGCLPIRNRESGIRNYPCRLAPLLLTATTARHRPTGPAYESPEPRSGPRDHNPDDAAGQGHVTQDGASHGVAHGRQYGGQGQDDANHDRQRQRGDDQGGQYLRRKPASTHTPHFAVNGAGCQVYVCAANECSDSGSNVFAWAGAPTRHHVLKVGGISGSSWGLQYRDRNYVYFALA